MSLPAENSNRPTPPEAAKSGTYRAVRGADDPLVAHLERCIPLRRTARVVMEAHGTVMSTLDLSAVGVRLRAPHAVEAGTDVVVSFVVGGAHTSFRGEAIDCTPSDDGFTLTVAWREPARVTERAFVRALERL